MLIWALSGTGCATIDFYAQAVTGHLQLLAGRRPVEEVIRDPGTDEAVKHKLRLVQSVRKFAADTLELPVDNAYSSYVETGKRYVVWNVFAAREFSLEMKTFCYPIAGCVAYRGYFHEDSARATAVRLREPGFDVFVGGVVAYS
ncbi:MAG: aminopeptidase, partial [Pseudomonadales bacterium]|nr:aminopeptidase [Pseudomonadales bacterium]